ncbi:MAG: Gfo/Idh/MocA family oxidoreductase [Candidatus Omnitrophota bacterium]|nr:Gfo/Idh/MocA family oxidoreductase [Candidatus Omnitrophota bacterium]
MKIGIIGIGKLGSIHLRICKEIQRIEEIYIVDTDKKKLQQHTGVTHLTDYQQLCGKVDAVSIVTPTSTHFELAKFFLERKIPVFVEKPITSNLKEANTLLSMAKNKKTLLFVGHVERYNNAYLAAKEKIKDPIFIECHRLSPYPHRSLDVGVVLDLMIHDLDIILDLLKDDIKNVQAKGVKVISSTEDIANVRITFKNGCVANITASRISEKKERKVRIFMRNCYISLDYAQQEAQIYKKGAAKITKDTLPINKEEPLKKEIIEFVNLVQNKTFDMDSAQGARNALELALKIQKIINEDPNNNR